MAIQAKTDLNSDYGSEYGKFHELATLGNQRTSSGNVSWTSLTSGTTYDTSTSSDPNILNKGENGLNHWLGQVVLINNVIDAAWINALIQAIAKSEQVYGTDSGSTDSYAISLPTAPTAYTLGMMLIFRANTANTDACSLNVNGLGAKAIKDINGNDLQTGAIKVNQMVSVIYNGTYFIMVSPSALHTTQDDGWKPVYETWTYASADSPTFTITVPSDATTKYAVGMRIKLTQTTVKYFIITAVATTTLTVYGGTDYTLANAAISSIFVSSVKCPFGFPQNPMKWSVETTSSSAVTQSVPTSGTWYNLGSLSISVPIGCWDISYDVNAQTYMGSGAVAGIKSTLSTSSNSESDKRMTAYGYSDGYGAVPTFIQQFYRKDTKTVASKTPMYLLMASTVAGTSGIYFSGDPTTIIRATCAYL